MKVNKQWMTGILVVVFLAGVFFMSNRRTSRAVSQQAGQGRVHEASENDIEYWTCSMHPHVNLDKPGKCPICGMELIPVHKGDQGKIIIDEQQKKYLGIESVPFEFKHLTKTIQLPGIVNHDGVLYSLQQEYLSLHESLNSIKSTSSPELLKRQESLLQSIMMRLNLLGVKETQIAQLLESKEPDKSLIYPSHGSAWVMADVYEQDLVLVKAEQQAAVKIKGYDKTFSGIVYAVEDVLDPRSRSAKARIKLIDVSEHLKHEIFAQVTLSIDLGYRVCAPESAVIDTGTRKVVYVDEGEGRYQMRQIETGVQGDGFIEVTQGVSAQEMVVTHGNFLLDSQTTLTGGQSLLYSGSDTVEAKDQQPAHRH